MERRGEVCFGQDEKERVVLCENEEEWKALYREGRGVKVRPFRVGLGGKLVLNFGGRWGL